MSTQVLRVLEQEADVLMRFFATFLVLSLIVIPRAMADERESTILLANIAVDRAATASSETADHPARLATDGDAATTWCPQSVPGSLTVDLGRVEDVSGFGVNLVGAAATGTIALSTAISPRVFRSLGPARTLPTGTPSWLPGAGLEPAPARFVRIEITGDPSLCIGELRVLGTPHTAP